MEGLASIALAVEHLERVERMEQEGYSSMPGHGDWPMAGRAPPSNSLWPSPAPVVRVVTQDSILSSSMDLIPNPRTMESNKSPTSTAVPLLEMNAKSSVSEDDSSNTLSSASHIFVCTMTCHGRTLQEWLEEDLPVNPPPPLSMLFDEPQEDDVLCGRGGETNHHRGNIQYRNLVKLCQQDYIAAKRRDKPMIAQKIVFAVRKLGGRFLKRDGETNKWRDVGNQKAREKTSQALREGAPELRVGSSSPTEKRGSDASLSHLDNDTVAAVVPPPPHLYNDIATMPSMYVDQASVMHMLPHNAKKIKVGAYSDMAPVAPPSMFWSMVMGTNHVIAPPYSNAMTTSHFPASISADDDEESKSSENSPSLSHSPAQECEASNSRGPRIKLLKRRLESDTGL